MMNKRYSKTEMRGLPGGPNEQFTYVTGVFLQDMYHVPMAQKGLEKYQYGGYPMSHTDSVAHQANKIVKYDQTRGGVGGTPLTSYSDPRYMKMLMNDIYPEVNKIMPNATAIEKGEAMDFIFNSGWDKYNKKIDKDPRAYALQEYYRKYDKSQLDKNGNWSGRRGAPYSFDAEYNRTVGKLPENERRILMNKGRDWYYKNTYKEREGWWYGKDSKGNLIRDKYGALSPAYGNTWYGRIWNTNDFSEFNPNNPKFTPNRQKGGEGKDDYDWSWQKPIFDNIEYGSTKVPANIKNNVVPIGNNTYEATPYSLPVAEVWGNPINTGRQLLQNIGKSTGYVADQIGQYLATPEALAAYMIDKVRGKDTEFMDVLPSLASDVIGRKSKGQPDVITSVTSDDWVRENPGTALAAEFFLIPGFKFKKPKYKKITELETIEPEDFSKIADELAEMDRYSDKDLIDIWDAGANESLDVMSKKVDELNQRRIDNRYKEFDDYKKSLENDFFYKLKADASKIKSKEKLLANMKIPYEERVKQVVKKELDEFWGDIPEEHRGYYSLKGLMADHKRLEAIKRLGSKKAYEKNQKKEIQRLTKEYDELQNSMLEDKRRILIQEGYDPNITIDDVKRIEAEKIKATLDRGEFEDDIIWDIQKEKFVPDPTGHSWNADNFFSTGDRALNESKSKLLNYGAHNWDNLSNLKSSNDRYKNLRSLAGDLNDEEMLKLFEYLRDFKQKGGEGYRIDAPNYNDPSKIIRGKKGKPTNITMTEQDGGPLKKGPLLGIDNMGNQQMMFPGYNYVFPGDMVMEIPVAQKGKGNFSVKPFARAFPINEPEFRALTGDIGIDTNIKNKPTYFRTSVRPTFGYSPLDPFQTHNLDLKGEGRVGYRIGDFNTELGVQKNLMRSDDPQLQASLGFNNRKFGINASTNIPTKNNPNFFPRVDLRYSPNEKLTFTGDAEYDSITKSPRFNVGLNYRFMQEGKELQKGQKGKIIKSIFDQYPGLYNVASPKDYKPIKAKGKHLEHLETTGTDVEYFAPGDTWYPFQYTTDIKLSVPGSKNKHRILYNPNLQNIEEALKLDIISHSYNTPETEALKADLDSKLRERYGDSMVDGNGGVDGYIRGYLSNSEEYAPYKKELEFLPKNYFKPFMEGLMKKQKGGITYDEFKNSEDSWRLLGALNAAEKQKRSLRGKGTYRADDDVYVYDLSPEMEQKMLDNPILQWVAGQRGLPHVRSLGYYQQKYGQDYLNKFTEEFGGLNSINTNEYNYPSDNDLLYEMINERRSWGDVDYNLKKHPLYGTTVKGNVDYSNDNNLYNNYDKEEEDKWILENSKRHSNLMNELDNIKDEQVVKKAKQDKLKQNTKLIEEQDLPLNMTVNVKSQPRNVGIQIGKPEINKNPDPGTRAWRDMMRAKSDQEKSTWLKYQQGGEFQRLVNKYTTKGWQSLTDQEKQTYKEMYQQYK